MNPTLVILAAGMGSRFGGLKQITAVDPYGHAIIDFSLYDAYRAGFRDVAFIIKHEIEKDFKKAVGYRMEEYFNVNYVYQQLDMLPAGYELPAERVKPWGTGHAVLCCKGTVKGPFAVINADDFYGPAAFSTLFDFLSSNTDDSQHAMVAYELSKTVSANGHVARGICSISDGFLTDIVERTHIEKYGDNGICRESENPFVIPGDTPVSMNCWAFSNSMLDELEKDFSPWLDNNLTLNPDKCEYYLPYAVNLGITSGSCRVKVLPCKETWHGITYKEDTRDVLDYISSLRDKGVYPAMLLD